MKYEKKLRRARRNPSIIASAVVGIYGLWHKRQLVYGGMSASITLNCAYRIARHTRKKDKPFDSYRVLELKGIKPEQIREIERSVICKLGPRYNKQHSRCRSRSKGRA